MYVNRFFTNLFTIFFRNEERRANMTTMNGVIRAGMLEGRERGRGSPYGRDAEMRKGRDLASRFMRGGGGWEVGKSSSDYWGVGAGWMTMQVG